MNKEHKQILKEYSGYMASTNWEDDCRRYIEIYRNLADFLDVLEKKKCFGETQLYTILYNRISAVYDEVNYLFPFENSIPLIPTNKELTVKMFMYEFKKTVERVRDLRREEPNPQAYNTLKYYTL